MSRLRQFFSRLMCKIRIHNYYVQREDPKELTDYCGDPTIAGVIIVASFFISGFLGLPFLIIASQMAFKGYPFQTPLIISLTCILIALVTERYRRGPTDKICRTCERVDLALSRHQIRESAKNFEFRQRRVPQQLRDGELTKKFQLIASTWQKSVGVGVDNTIAPDDHPDRVLPLADKLNPNARRVL